MKTLYALLLAAAGAPLATSAQTDKPAPAPYQSALAGYQRTPELAQTPDQTWRQANREVAAPGQGQGHMGHVGHMGHMRHGASVPAPAAHAQHGSAQAAPKDAAKPAAQPHQHKDH